ncbi:ATP-binding cassette domain-containing protein [Conexibacter stalactiti]|uniref:ATP-binding cassette domain-containing protein n=1 Tax=Conexibacter stalactiti TaxID=1940611 RepID=A0ABU4HJN0_9ACTN|nr:ATP-binding cassette domain-containing protein [Conexibacter stalactiti]MDW5593472.1 ATP-binding cassette domain-containing protein [Conexibacter stalactiti]MEC5034113.1 ATP-binding cassette domain-containing protein [Conexibacter stalactiti]
MGEDRVLDDLDAPLLELDDVARSHQGGPYLPPLLDGARLRIAAGDFVAVWGSPRSGKTTLLRIASGIEPPDRGTVRVSGIDLATLSPSKRGAVRLETVGLADAGGADVRDLKLVDYLALPVARRLSRRQAVIRARETLSIVGIEHTAELRWSMLDDGQRARAGLAHALVRGPRLLLVDDVTRNMGAVEEAEIVGLLTRLVRDSGLAVLLTSSTLSAAVGAHETYILRGGTLDPVDDSSLRVARMTTRA